MDSAKETVRAVNAALAAAQREREMLVARLAALDALIADLEAAAAPVGGRGRDGRAADSKATGKKTTRKTSGRRRRQGPSRTDRIVSVLERADGPLTTGQVRERLAAHEPQVSSGVVSAALAQLRNRGRVRKDNDGRWALTST